MHKVYFCFVFLDARDMSFWYEIMKFTYAGQLVVMRVTGRGPEALDAVYFSCCLTV